MKEILEEGLVPCGCLKIARDSSQSSHLTRSDFTQRRCISASVKISPKVTDLGLFAQDLVPAACFDYGGTCMAAPHRWLPKLLHVCEQRQKWAVQLES